MLLTLFLSTVGYHGLPEDATCWPANTNSRSEVAIAAGEAAKGQTDDPRELQTDDVYLITPSHQPRRIHRTAPGTRARFIRWSPEGARVYFIEDVAWSADYNADGNEVFYIDVKTGRVRPLLAANSRNRDTTMMGFTRWLAHSPDGRQIAVSRGGGRYLGSHNRVEVIFIEPLSSTISDAPAPFLH